MEDFASELEVLLEHSSSDTNNNASSVSSSRSPGEPGEEHCTAFLSAAAPPFRPEIHPAARFPPPAHYDQPESSAVSAVRSHGPARTGAAGAFPDRAPRAFSLRYHATYLNPTGDPVLDPNWDAIESYLAGQVRPGPDVARVYKCSTCGLEFPNAQAFGGHMSSHSKGRRAGDRPLAGRRERAFKKAGKKEKRHKLSAPAPPQVTAADERGSTAADERGSGDDVSGAAEQELNYVEFIDTCKHARNYN